MILRLPLGVFVSVLLTVNALAFLPPKNSSLTRIEIKNLATRPQIIRIPSRLGKPAHPIKINYDALSHAPRILSGPLAPTQAVNKDYVARCKAYILEHSSYFGIKNADLVWLEDALLITPIDQFVKFKVKRDGILIQDSNIDCRFKHGHLAQVINQSYAEAKVKNDDQSEASFSLEGYKLASEDAEPVYRVIKNSNDGRFELVKVKTSLVTDREGNLLKMQRSVTSGNIMELKDTKHYFHLKVRAPVYFRSYLEPVEFLPLPFLNVNITKISQKPTNRLGEIVDVIDNASPFVASLNGLYTKINDKSHDPIRGEATEGDEGLEINLVGSLEAKPWQDKKLAQVMGFYHINKIKERAKAYVQSKWLNAKLKTNVNIGFSCNAFYEPVLGTLNFLRSSKECANSALIADIIYHEFGHALDANSGGIDDDAFSEGFGDILSLVMNHDPKVGSGMFLDSNRYIRDISEFKVYPDDTGEVHDEGQIIGSTFYDLYVELMKKYPAEKAQDILANYAFKMIFTARTYHDVYDALLFIDSEEEQFGTARAPNHCIINRSFSSHGLTDLDPDC